MPISCDDLARVLEKREPGERFNVLAVPVERHHGGSNVYALVDTERKDALHHPGDARTCAAAVLGRGRPPPGHGPAT
jgi:hypothetical protein